MGMTSIWENDFYDTPPQPLYAFETVWDQYTDLDVGDAMLLSRACTNISIFSREIQMPPVYYGGVELRYPARATNAGELSVTFAEINTMRIYTILNGLFDKTSYNHQWYKQTENDGNKYREPYNKMANKIIVKTLRPDSNFMYYTDGGEYTKKIIYHNCTLIKLDQIDFDATSEEVVNITATFSFDFMTIEDGETESEQKSETDIIERESVNADGNVSKSVVQENSEAIQSAGAGTAGSNGTNAENIMSRVSTNGSIVDKTKISQINEWAAKYGQA